ncbi:hypothetical protein NDA11_000127 [Ustilago hordei]|uniref:Uncharacterized protein n=1 Tax=Ustilago hordei TaxID=120017 RepID=I2G268_USTHO|nr:uncharacterized protein UHO2_02580 [Ustilago hordei]KAJ1040252.1 hypothetical protein NDA10_004585 [Ustilago hordei]KAJ1588200.1 hypothetical protein NDA12_004962 [Ustilago hordei]KAJ1592635.1 hypothetical protein NDA11_000127 [Ustilago hordei]KAJ1601484.1 hypothetical protein NDA14_003098 [Ustilago hordei]UTT93961.1 hypothetical protein NDA17_007455 [Ustilago hordei]
MTATDQNPTPQPNAEDAKYRISWSLPGSAERNSPAIAEALSPMLTSTSCTSSSRKPLVLEVASGFGHQMHAIACRHPSIQFHPSEADAYPRTRIDSTISSLPNVAKAESLDLLSQNDWTTLVHNISSETSAPLPGEDEGLFDGVIACNLTHIAPWSVTQSLFSHLDPRLGYATQQGYRNILQRDGWIAIYGAFNENGGYTSEGNQKFDAEIKSRNPEFGLRDVQVEMIPVAERHGFVLAKRTEMPAGNLFLIFKLWPD